MDIIANGIMCLTVGSREKLAGGTAAILTLQPSRCLSCDAGLQAVTTRTAKPAPGAEGQTAPVEAMAAALGQRLLDSPSARRTLVAVLNDAQPPARLILLMAVLRACNQGGSTSASTLYCRPHFAAQTSKPGSQAVLFVCIALAVK